MRAIPCIALCLLAGCLARPPLDKQTFLFAPPPPSAQKSAPDGRVLGLRSLEVAEPFQGKSFVYRTGDFSYEQDDYAEFMVHPADGLAQPIITWLRQSGPFSSVVEDGSAQKPNTLVEISVAELYGDFRKSDAPAAVLSMRFVFFDAPKGVPGKVLLQREYSRAIPLKARSAGLVIAGWNEALAQILDSATTGFLQTAQAPTAAPSSDSHSQK